MVGKVKQRMVYIVAAVLAVDFILFGYGPSRQRLKNLKRSQEYYHKIMSNSLTQRKKLIALKSQITNQQEALVQWKTRIPAKPEIGPFVQTVAQLMSQHGLVDQGIEPSQERQVNRLGIMPLTLRCRGDLNQLFGFYRDLQKQSRLIRIQQLRLHHGDQASRSIEMETDVVLFYGTPEMLQAAS